MYDSLMIYGATSGNEEVHSTRPRSSVCLFRLQAYNTYERRHAFVLLLFYLPIFQNYYYTVLWNLQCAAIPEPTWIYREILLIYFLYNDENSY